ncbi:hypothetical protein [Tunturiibacter gelidoferens]|uniref:Uncharacterized protein n=1 Tax=Tunturiibacter gelidiferens TaxID=3069689 RepID=A0A9X0QCR8_9BACT|nr:hypothetical protein [Edaphobacter lichenicola]MBB5327929.1 hypothetical protein [Edaphobacter lichenicola]
MTRKIKFTKQYKPMAFGDRDDKGSLDAHQRAKAEAKETRRYNMRMKELEAEDARRRGGILTKVVRFFSSKHRTR